MDPIKLGFFGRLVELDETGSDGKARFKVQALRVGRYTHPAAKDGVLDITEERIKEIHANFSAKARGKDVPCDEVHADKLKRRAVSWITSTEISADGKQLFAKGYFTSGARGKELAEAVKAEEVKYFSPELLLGWKDTEDKRTKDVLKGGAWTNFPWIKDMEPAQMINCAEIAADDAEFGTLLSDFGMGPSRDDPQKKNPGGNTPPVGKGGPSPAPDPTKQMGGGGSRLADAEDEDAQDPDLPMQCTSCRLLMDGSCPFAGIDVKVAAAGDGLCPQYESEQVAPTSNNIDTGGGNNEQQGDQADMDEAAVKKMIAEANEIQLGEFNKKLEEKDKVILSLQAEVVDLAEDRKSRVFRDSMLPYIQKGFAPAVIDLCEKILLADRSDDGTIELSENGATEKVGVEQLMFKLLDTMEPTVKLSEETTRRMERPGDDKANGTQISLDETVWARAAEMAKASGGTAEDHYGRAVRDVASGGRRGGRR